MNNNDKSNYDAFFQHDPKDEDRSNKEDWKEGRPSYYVYGSFKNDAAGEGAGYSHDSQSEQRSVLSSNSGNSTSAANAYSGKIEISRPAPVKPMYTESSQQNHKRDGKTSNLRNLIASFIGGASVVALFLVIALQTNLFAAGGDTIDSVPPAGSNGENISTSASASAQSLVRPETFSNIVDLAGPAVVKIETMVNQSTSSLYDDDILRWFFGDRYTIPQQQDQGKLVPGGVGSGFIFEKNGYIFTNQHVIDGAQEIWVTVQGYAEPFKAELLGSDYEMDLAVIKIDGDSEFPTLKIGDSSLVNVGDWVTAIGNPLGFDHTVSVGVLSAKERDFSIPDESGLRGPRYYDHLLQTDASINPGNSGGPLLNLNGEVIGMNTAVSTNAQGIGFAIPSSTLLEVVDRLKNGEQIEKPYIGVTLTNLDEELAEQLNLSSSDGVVVVQVLRDSPAYVAGLKPYDVIVEFNGETVQDIEDLQSKISDAGVGAKVTITIVRDGNRYDTGLIIGDRNDISS